MAAIYLVVVNITAVPT